jgi:cyclopropane fatty-acyl-phospholipid synthase-like methyltransferase
MALHYGIWLPETKNFLQSLENTNRIMLELGNIEPGSRILDAGCGVGGAAIFLARRLNVRVTGITLSSKQLITANQNAGKHKVDSLVDFSLQDYTKTTFPDKTFDLIWACESISSATAKSSFANEALRLLKPGGRLVLSDFFKSPEVSEQSTNLLQQWSDTWAMAPLITADELTQTFAKAGLNLDTAKDYTREIYPTAKKMYRGYLWGSVPSLAYNFLFGAGKYSRLHYRSGYYQYKALRLGLWQYKVMLFSKAP